MNGWRGRDLAENLSIETGFPFGPYHHDTGPELFDAPIAVGPTYFARLPGFGVTTLSSWLSALRHPDVMTADRAGQMWSTRAIYGSMTLISLLRICFIGVVTFVLQRRAAH